MKKINTEIEELRDFCEKNEEKIKDFEKRIYEIRLALTENPDFVNYEDIEKELVLMRNEAMYGTGEEKLEKLSIH